MYNLHQTEFYHTEEKLEIISCCLNCGKGKEEVAIVTEVQHCA